MPFAKRDARRFDSVSRRPTRWPAMMPVAALAGSRSGVKSFGSSAGGFCPSPSSVQTMAPLAARTPEWTAALWPAERSWRRSRRCGRVAISAWTTAAVSSVEPSSTTITSWSVTLAQAASISSRRDVMLSDSFLAGMTTETLTMWRTCGTVFTC